jgi:hypothetical protein
MMQLVTRWWWLARWSPKVHQNDMFCLKIIVHIHNPRSLAINKKSSVAKISVKYPNLALSDDLCLISLLLPLSLRHHRKRARTRRSSGCASQDPEEIRRGCHGHVGYNGIYHQQFMMFGCVGKWGIPQVMSVLKGQIMTSPLNSGVIILFSEKPRGASLAISNTNKLCSWRSRTVAINLTLLTQLLHLAEQCPHF